MKYCPKCGSDSYVIDSRDKPYGIRRRRQCENCGYKWTTLETRIESYMRFKVDKLGAVYHNNIE